MNIDKKLGTEIDFPPLVTPDDELAIEKFYKENPELKSFSLKNAWIQTFSGRKIYPLNPYIDSIVIQDIAHSLSNQCRFTGHTKDFYSVAQHSVLVSYLCNRENALYGLLHDASEYILVDIPSPLKKTHEFFNYRNIEKRVQSIIYKRFELSETEPDDVKYADSLLLATEARDLMSPLHSDWKSTVKPLPFKIEPLPPKEAEKLFLERFEELY